MSWLGGCSGLLAAAVCALGEPQPLPVAGAERPRVLAHTCPTDALPASVLPTGVLGCKLVAPNAVCFPGIHGGWSYAAMDVEPHRDWFHVLGIDASPVAAKVVNAKAWRDLSNKLPVGEPVSIDVHSSEPILSVSVTDGALPFPASGLDIDADLAAKSLRQLGGVHSNLLPSGQGADGQFNDRRAGDRQRLVEFLNQPETLGAQSITSCSLVSHERKIPPVAVEVKR